MRTSSSFAILATALALALPVAMRAQDGRGGAQPPRTGRSIAPVDITGYWVSQIVDEWRFRVTPQKGDIAYLPINAEARRVAQGWDPAKDEADGKACKAYGAVGIMQRPGRMHITWADNNTFKIEIDTGTQTRLLHFGPESANKGAPSWQGYSQAVWVAPGAVLLDTGGTGFVPGLGGGRGRGGAPPKTATLRVTTTNMLAGYIRKNGVPYSDKAVLTEYFNLLTGQQNEPYLIMTAFVEDPAYLDAPFIRTYTWKPVADNTGWDPTPCLPK